MTNYRRAPRREAAAGKHDHLFSTTMQVLMENTNLGRIRELGEREGLTVGSMARQLILEALTARERGGSRPEGVDGMSPPLSSRGDDGRRSPVEGGSASRTRATPRRRDVV